MKEGDLGNWKPVSHGVIVTRSWKAVFIYLNIYILPFFVV